MKTLIFTSYNGSQQGVTIRSQALTQLSYINLGININGINAGTDSDLFLAAANHIYHYKTDGTLITDMTFPINTINYTDVTLSGDKIIASYNGSQQGFTIRDQALNQITYVQTGFDINGISAGGNDDLFIASANHIYHYKLDGTLITNMAFPVASINYTDVTVSCDKIIASYNGSQQGFTIRDQALNQLSYVQTGFDISGISAGINNDVFLSSGNNIYRYSLDGTQLEVMTFPVNSINYTRISTLIAN